MVETQLQLFPIDVIPSAMLDMDDWYSCQAHGDFALYHYYSQDLLQKLLYSIGHVPCPFCLIEKENQEEYRRKNGS